MVESTHCTVPVALAGQEFRRARAHACLVSTVTRTSLLGRHWTSSQMENLYNGTASKDGKRIDVCHLPCWPHELQSPGTVAWVAEELDFN